MATPLVGSATIPFHRLATILGNALSLFIHHPQITLRVGIVLLIRDPDQRLQGFGVPLLGSAGEPLRRLLVILDNTEAPLLIDDAYLKLCLCPPRPLLGSCEPS